eukprot:TRINITY_DN4691_c0_g1_i1.p1 TRINITY_DN4691_c0_g1~~TRINITY_DN4691_c0_g1_i1.p1  ORF type:complete len:130 (-),score=36.29 TRINITY_DN4691_c0_g1_i1:92-481(-)
MGWGGGGKGWGGCGGNGWGGGVWMPMFNMGKGKGKGKGPNLNKFDAAQKVWVGNLPEEKPSWKDLMELCKTVGTVKWVEPLGKRSKAESCVVFSTAEEAAAAIAQLQGSMIGDKPITLDVWNKKETTPA